MDINFSDNETYLVSETIINLDLDFEYNSEQVRRSLLKGIEIAANGIKSPDINYYVIMEEGSTIGKILGFGTLLYFGIGAYGDFRQGINQIGEDITWVSGKIIGGAQVDNPSINNNTITSVQFKAGLPGRLKEILDRIEYLKSKVFESSSKEIEAELNKLYQELSNIIALLNASERAAFLQNSPRNLVETLPPPDREKMDTIYKTYFIKPDEFRVRKR